MKKFMALLLSVAMLITLSSCKKNTAETETTEPHESVSETVSETYDELEIKSEEEKTERITQAAMATTVQTTAVQTTSTPSVLATKPAPSTAKPTEPTTKKTVVQTTDKKSESVSFSVNCSDILYHMEDLKKGKEYFVPSDGVIFAVRDINIREGETVFDLLKRLCADNDIQLEYAYSGAFGTYYIEGINQLYEKDCGRFSGWIYQVNGVEPSVGCSAYKLKDGDAVEFIFNCDSDF